MKFEVEGIRKSGISRVRKLKLTRWADQADRMGRQGMHRNVSE